MKINLLCLLIMVAIPLEVLSQPVEYPLGSGWKAKRAADMNADGTVITGADFRMDGWIEAVVPGTVLTTLLHNQLIPDPFFGLNNNLIPDVYDTGRDYYTYWFYNEFQTPE